MEKDLKLFRQEYSWLFDMIKTSSLEFHKIQAMNKHKITLKGKKIIINDGEKMTE